jgi:hypothetical protein
MGTMAAPSFKVARHRSGKTGGPFVTECSFRRPGGPNGKVRGVGEGARRAWGDQ